MSGRFVAKQDIPWGGVLAYTRGQTVEADAVEANGWQDYVVGENTKEAREARRSVGAETGTDDKPAAKAADTTKKSEG